MRIGAVAPSTEDGVEFARRVRLMDEVGLDSLWLYETYFDAESFSRAGFIAALTKHARIGAGVINPYTRHPGLIAMAAASLDRLSNGRSILLMGTGAPDWIRELLGYTQRKPVGDLVDAIEVVRRMLSGGKVNFSASGFKISNAQLEVPASREVPIYVAENEKSDAVLSRTSRVADGFYLGHGNRPIGYMRRTCASIRKSRERPGPLQIGAQFALRITDDSKREIKELKPWLAFYLSLPVEGERVLQFSGLERSILEPIRKALKTPELISQGRNVFEAFNVGNMAEAVNHVPDELVDQCSVIGTPQMCRERLSELERSGLSFVALSFQTRFSETISKIKDLLH